MGTTYHLGKPDTQEYVDLESPKMGWEMHSKYATSLLRQFLMMQSGQFRLEWLPDHAEHWHDWKDITCDVLVDLFESDWKPDKWEFANAYGKFKEAGRLSELKRFMDDTPAKNDKEAKNG